eukprot:g2759.t1
MDSMLASLLVNKPRHPVEHLVVFVAREHAPQFRRALHELDEPLPSTVFSDSEGDPSDGEDDGVHRTRLPISTSIAHSEHVAREEAAAAEAALKQQRRDQTPLATAVEEGQRAVLARVAADYGIDEAELVSRLIEGRDIAATRLVSAPSEEEGALPAAPKGALGDTEEAAAAAAPGAAPGAAPVGQKARFKPIDDEKEYGLADLRVTRDYCAKVVEEPFFERAVTGGFVKVAIGMREGKTVYRICRIKAVVPAVNNSREKKPIEYVFPSARDKKRRVNVSVQLEFAGAVKDWKLTKISNHSFTAAEFQEWMSATKQAGQPLLKPSQARKQAKAMRAAAATAYRREDIEALVKQRRARKQTVANPTTERTKLETRAKAVEEKIAEYLHRLQQRAEGKLAGADGEEASGERRAAQEELDALPKQEQRRRKQLEDRATTEREIKQNSRQHLSVKQELAALAADYVREDAQMRANHPVVMWREENIEKELEVVRRAEAKKREKSAASKTVNRMNKINDHHHATNTSVEVTIAEKQGTAWRRKKMEDKARGTAVDQGSVKDPFARARCAPKGLWLTSGKGGLLTKTKSPDGVAPPPKDDGASGSGSGSAAAEGRPSLKLDGAARVRQQIAALPTTPAGELMEDAIDLPTPHTPGEGAASRAPAPAPLVPPAAAPPAAGAAPRQRKGLSLKDYKARRAAS